MQSILKILDPVDHVTNLEYPNLENVHFVSSPKNNLMGVHLGRDFLMLDATHYLSFRIKEGNFNYIKPVQLFSYRRGFDKDYMEQYFCENEDNPYAIQFVMNLSHRAVSFSAESKITQFPPLFYRKPHQWYQKACERLLAHAEVGDTLFSYNRQSKISRLIRRIDKSPWSHCDTIHANKQIVGMSASGFNRDNLVNCFDPSRDLALYRLKLPLSEEQKALMVLQSEIRLAFKLWRYGWRQVFKVFLRKKYGLFRHSSPPSVADLIYSNSYQLIDYC
jgi:hypothetical protein